MAHLQLRGRPLIDDQGSPQIIEAVLFDKDGTMSISEPMLHTLAEARVFQCLELARHRDPALATAAAAAELESLLRRAYGLLNSNRAGAGAGATMKAWTASIWAAPIRAASIRPAPPRSGPVATT